jgi:hypothetical protein
MKGHIRTGIVCALIGAFAAIGTVAFAGTGVGGVFNLGQTNTVDNATSLLSGSNNAAMLAVSNTNTGPAASGLTGSTASAGGAGVTGSSSAAGAGVKATSSKGNAVLASSNGPAATIRASNTAAGPAAAFFAGPTVAPFTVSSSHVVTGLNSDLLDGMNASDLTGKAYAEPDAFTNITLNNANYTTVVSVVVPAGSYFVSFTATSTDASSTSPNDFVCTLVAPSGADASIAYSMNDVNVPQSTISDQALISAPSGGTISVQCFDGNSSVQIYYPSLIANAVGTLNGAAVTKPVPAAPSIGRTRP